MRPKSFRPKPSSSRQMARYLAAESKSSSSRSPARSCPAPSRMEARSFWVKNLPRSLTARFRTPLPGARSRRHGSTARVAESDPRSPAPCRVQKNGRPPAFPGASAGQGLLTFHCPRGPPPGYLFSARLWSPAFVSMVHEGGSSVCSPSASRSPRAIISPPFFFR